MRGKNFFRGKNKKHAGKVFFRVVEGEMERGSSDLLPSDFESLTCGSTVDPHISDIS
jgi:hypothetical protein